MAIRAGQRSISTLLPTIHNPLTLPFSSPPLPLESSAAVSAAVSVLRHHRNRSRWSNLRSLLHPAGISPEQFTAVVVHLKNSPRLAIRFFLWSQRRRLCRHDPSSLSAVIHILARSRLRSAALSLLRSASVSAADEDPDRPPEIFEALARTYRAFDSAPFVFDLLIRAFLDCKKLDRAIQIVRLLRSRGGIRPMIGTSNALIRSFAQTRGSDAGFEVFVELFGDAGSSVRVRVSPNVQTFNTLLLAFYRDGRLDSAEEIRVEMERLGCEPNVFTYSVLMAGFCDEGMIGEAKKLWGEMIEKEIKPDIVSFNTMIGGYCGVGEMEMAEELYGEMTVNEIEPTCATFEHLIAGHCKAGDLDATLLVYRDMRRRRHDPEVSTVDEVIEGMCKKGRVADGLGILRDEMKREGGFCPSRRSYELLVRGFCEEGELDAALKLQAEMAGRGHEVDSKVYGAFIEGYKRQGDFDKASKLEGEMLEFYMTKEGT